MSAYAMFHMRARQNMPSQRTLNFLSRTRSPRWCSIRFPHPLPSPSALLPFPRPAVAAAATGAPEASSGL
ncbi:uncharacterized protein LAJ45_05666 [Morchella importuna]|uniref:uncharacterized protein n=1 Tax=Morchella importuna TaxID=1174673 RepID=UPI001E8E23F1|nr:uncharacterized protein LAJ45_05666 [Morchella importuna]KAH8150453.1 hypothetical protein LAJ45_05666 [Morchella importuna]